MSLRQQMLQVARRSSKSLKDSTQLVAEFLKTQESSEGGFNNRAGEADLYFGFFGLESAEVIGAKIDYFKWQKYLKSFDQIQDLDLVHLSCLIRCWANLPQTMFVDNLKDRLADGLEKFRSKDGAFNTQVNQEYGTAYACFVALDSFDNLERPIIKEEALVTCINKVQTESGSYALAEKMKYGTSPTTAAAIVALLRMGVSANDLERAQSWLLTQEHALGGFKAAEGAPIPDLLSTATVLHTLSCLGVDLTDKREKTLDFIDSLWVNKGGFYAHWSDDQLDTEYLYYGLLALGHLI